MSWIAGRRAAWAGLRSRIFAPIEAALAAGIGPGAPAAGPPAGGPVVWLLGKTGAGKTSIVAALTGDARAVVGQGYRPATQTSSFYGVPDDAPVLRFLDTRGLGEPDYDPAADIAWCEAGAHTLLCVVRISDQAQDEVVRTVRAVRRRHPGWPVIVAQTGLHDFYPHGAGHPLPYPFTGGVGDFGHAGVPSSVGEALRVQRAAFADLGAGAPPRFVPIDFTQPDSGYLPADYGAEALVDALVDAGVAVVGDLGRLATADRTRRAARLSILGYAAAAGLGGAAPLPGIGIPATVAAQAGMLYALAGRYGVVLTVSLFRDFAGMLASGALVYGVLVRLWLGEAAKAVPVVGTAAGVALNGVGAFALTYALGEAACVYFAALGRGRAPVGDEVRDAFRAALADGLARARAMRPNAGPA